MIAKESGVKIIDEPELLAVDIEAVKVVGTTTNQNSLFRSRDRLSANQGSVFPVSVHTRRHSSILHKHIAFAHM